MRELGRAGVDVGPPGVADELADLLVGEAGQPQPDDVVGAAQVGERLRERGREVGLGVAEGGEHQHPRPAGGAGQVTQEQERRRVGPVPVLEHEQHRARRLTPASRSVTAVCSRWRSVSGSALTGCGSSPDPLRQVGEQPRQLAARGAQRGPQLGGLDLTRQVIERLDERPVRRVHDRVAAAVEHERAGAGRLACELAHQAALARAGLAAQQDDPPALALRHRHERAQRLQLGRAADERKRRREA